MAIFGRKKPGEDSEKQEQKASKAVSSGNGDLAEEEFQENPHLSPLLQDYRDKIFDRLIARIDIKSASRLGPKHLRNEVEGFIAGFIEEDSAPLTLSDQQKIALDIVNEMVGLGPLEPLFEDPDVSDILVNSPKDVFIEVEGKLKKTNVQFRDDRHVLQVGQRIASKAGRRVDESSPLLDTRLTDGSRVNVAIPPVALNGVSISIRRFRDRGISLEKMAEQQNISPNMLAFFEILGKSRLNVIVSGGTGAGKTTFLNALAQCIDENERIVTIEDAAELRLPQPHVVRLESRPPNIEGEGEIAIRDLVKNSLRMRPDRLVVGECRGAEAFDMLQAMNTGHDGSMSTLHANNAEESLHRLENMVLMAGFNLPVAVVKGYIAGAIDIVVQVARMRDGVRRVVEVIEILNLNPKGEIETNTIFSFVPTGLSKTGRIEGVFRCVNQTPNFLPKIEYLGLGEELKKCLK